MSASLPANGARGARRRQRGSAAVELALILMLLFGLLTVPLLFGRVFMHYSMAQKAAHDAARFLASAPQRDIRWARLDSSEIGVAALARAIARETLAEANTGLAVPAVDVYCDGETCIGNTTPTKVQVIVRMSIYDGLFGMHTGTYTGDYGLALRADVSMPYVGR
jgi:Flp pilus assembly protein TadG